MGPQPAPTASTASSGDDPAATPALAAAKLSQRRPACLQPYPPTLETGRSGAARRPFIWHPGIRNTASVDGVRAAQTVAITTATACSTNTGDARSPRAVERALVGRSGRPQQRACVGRCLETVRYDQCADYRQPSPARISLKTFNIHRRRENDPEHDPAAAFQPLHACGLHYHPFR